MAQDAKSSPLGVTAYCPCPRPSPAREDAMVRFPPNFWNSSASASVLDLDWMRSDASAAGMNLAASS